MQISHNGKMLEVSAIKLDQLLIELGYADAIVVTAINGEFVPIEKRSKTSVEQGDALEVLAPMQGG